MNLKESFRYQNYLERLLDCADRYLDNPANTQQIVKTHLRNAKNKDAEDTSETMERPGAFSSDDMVRFILYLIDERSKLTKAIHDAKASTAPFNLDVAVETNKFRQLAARAIKCMLERTPYEKIERGSDYKFNVEGNQVAYFYDVKVSCNDAFDREKARDTVRSILIKSDETSTQIDQVMVDTDVIYTPPFNVNDTFDDAMNIFLAATKPE